MALERLQKIMAAAGVASRRKSEELITAGRVSVNGQVVSELGAKADPERDHIRVDGKLLHGAERKVYLLLNKPKGYVSTVSDPQGRPTVMDLVRGEGARLYPVGRLDYASEGLLLLTNDGELSQQLTRAASHVPKTYLVKVSGKPSEEAIARLRGGILLRADRPGGRAVKAAPARISLARDAENPWYEVTLTEGRNRQIRRMFEQVGHHVEKIKRVRYGPLELDVPPGEYRRLTGDEVARLQRPQGARKGTRTK
ncbi:MAG: pseudouridine synthase [Terriglobales bacterium]